MIANIIKFISGAILLFFVYLYINASIKEDGKLPVPKSEAKINMDKLFELGQDKKGSKLHKGKEIAQQSKILDQSIEQSTNTNIESKQTYLELYQQLKRVQQCELASQTYRYNLLRINTDDIDPQEVINNKIENPSPLQIQIWMELFQDCEQLAIDYGHMHESDINAYKTSSYFDNYIIEEEIYDLLFSTSAKSEEEISLKMTLIDSKIYSELGERVSLNNEKKYSLPKQQVTSIKQEIDELQELLNQLEQTVENFIDTEKYTQINNEIEANIEKIEQASSPDEQAYQQQIDKFTNLHNRFIKKLKTKNGVEFNLALFTLLNMQRDRLIHKSRYSVEKFKLRQINHEIYLNSGIKDHEYFQIIIYPTINLFQCLKGVDCSETSEFAINYCLGIDRRNADPAACDVDLVSFYFQNYLTENQLLDIQKILNYLELNHDE